jgi:MYXO-CTERM domain-containing protein
MTPKFGIAILTAGSLLALDGAAHAQVEVLNTHITSIANGEDCGRINRDENGREKKGDNYQACAEHATLAQLNDGRDVVMFRLASKDVLEGVEIFDRAQLACTSVTLTPTGPVVNTDKYVTRNDGNQYRNAHASVAIPIGANNEAVAVFYNYRPNNPNNTQRYVQVFDKDCNSLSAQTLVMANNNDDMCASAENYSHIVTGATATETRVVATCGGNGNNDDAGWVYETVFEKKPDGKFTADRTWRLINIQDEERTRQTGTFIPGENLFVACASDGNAQPTNKGVACTGIDTSIGGEVSNNARSRLLWKQYVARRDGRIYQTQIKLAPSLVDPSQVTASWTTIRKENRRGKGQSMMNLARLSFTREGMEIVALPVQLADGTDATHRAMISAPYGVDGQEKDAFLLVSSSLNGSPNSMAAAQVMTWDATAMQFVRNRRIGLNSAIDNQWISNIYGNNPNTQGRNHVQSKVIMNPYYGATTGFQTQIKSWVATAATPRRMREGATIAEDKLSFELLLTPVQWAPEVVLPPEEEDPIDPTDPTDPVVPEEPTPTPTDPGSGSTVGGCSTGGSSTGLGTLALLGLALVVTRRRRNA